MTTTANLISVLSEAFDLAQSGDASKLRRGYFVFKPDIIKYDASFLIDLKREMAQWENIEGEAQR